MKKPSIHLNGTSPEVLCSQQEEILRSCNELLDALYKNAPHARDYYPQGENAYHEANDEFLMRVKLVKQVRYETERMLEYLADAQE